MGKPQSRLRTYVSDLRDILYLAVWNVSFAWVTASCPSEEENKRGPTEAYRPRWYSFVRSRGIRAESSRTVPDYVSDSL